MLPLVELECACDEAITRVEDALVQTGLRVMMSFDLNYTRASTAAGACLHHGTDACDCQIVIFLVYDVNGRPVTILAHGQDGKTWVSLVIAAEQRPPSSLESKIKKALLSMTAARTEVT